MLRRKGLGMGTAWRLTRAGVLAVAVAIGGARPAEAQAELLGPGAVFLGVGLSGVAIGQLDDHLEARGYPTFGRSALALGLGAYRVLSNGVMLGAEWHGLVFGEEPHEGGEVGLGGGYGTLGVGYAVALSPRARVYPRLGLGAGGMGLWIEPADDGVAFDDVLDDPRPAPGRRPVLSRAGVVVDVGAGAELLAGGDGGGLLIGLRLGYLAAASAPDWYLYERDASGGPDASLRGPYVRLVVGAAWSR